MKRLLAARKAAREAERQAFQQKQEHKNLLRNMKIYANSQAAFHITAAQEQDVFSAWTVFTGTYLSGPSKGEPRIPDRMKPNSLCLLTKRGAGVQEASRRIIGAFMVGEDFFGADCRSGTVAAHPVHRVALRPEKGLAFWPYFTRDPEKQRWGKTALKYFSNQTAEKILFDLLGLADTAEEREAALRFYPYFCRLNRIPPRDGKAEEPSRG